ncbi:hypothetical protein [Nonomuraea basaltis]|uniref:hypothetical protein n=1 Tax=Nonomuraea basaltis TaxID=2495887 RepID=UPI00110C47FD|nr:hypothetical protein [Nonomuraea basaltis]TMS00125.1 hypothetical protein EJK15_03375 [Nonomuraea basaltis]
MTALDQITPLSAEQRDALIKLHEYDELIFGGFICLHCTPDDCDDPDDNVYYPCPPLRAVGVTNEEAVLIIKLARAERAAKHMGDALTNVGTAMQSAASTAHELGAGAGMDVIVGYLSDAGMLPAGLLTEPQDGGETR